MPNWFTEVEIDGHTFPVLKYIEQDWDAIGITQYVLLRLSSNQLQELHRFLFQHAVLHVKRIGVDTQSRVLQLGYNNFWSKHENDGQIYYKQILRFFPIQSAPLPSLLSPPPPPGPDLVIRHFSVSDLALKTAIQFAALVDLLAAKGLLQPQEQLSLLADDIGPLVDEDRLQTLSWLLLRTEDAEVTLQ